MMKQMERAPARRLLSWGAYVAGGCLLALASACVQVDGEGGGRGDLGEQIAGGTTLAVLELEAPSLPEFVLRGTIPVPPGTFPRSDGLLPLAIRGPNGFVVPTSVRTVSSYASSTQGADVVEVSGRVSAPGGKVPGERLAYQVVYEPHEASALTVRSEVQTLLDTPLSVVLRARDVFGHTYAIDLLDDLRAPDGASFSEALERGVASAHGRSYGVMKPVGAPLGEPSGALKHLFGVHAYVTAWTKTPGLNLSLRVHNGFDGYNQNLADDDPLGVVYFKDLELLVPSGWVAMLDLEDLFTGNAYAEGSSVVLPLIKPNSNGSMHLMPHQAQFQRRLGLSVSSDPGLALHLANEEGLGFVRRGMSPDGGELYSWWNKGTARYWPQKQPLPDLEHVGVSSLESKFTSQYWMVRNALETGAPGDYQVPSTALGWAHPWGVSYGGMTGGEEIYLYDGVQLAQARTNKAWKFTQTVQRMLNDRQPTALYDRFGEPTALEKWVIFGPSFPFIGFNFWQELKGGPDPFGFSSAPQFQVQYVQQQGLTPPYQSGLFAYKPIDFQHYVRYTRIPKVLAWLGNDLMAKDDMLQVAENYRLSHHEYPNSSGKKASGSGLWDSEQFVTQNPNHGFGFGRGEAWGLDALVSAYGLGSPEYRNKLRPWFSKSADVIAQGQTSCSGFIQAQVVGGWLNGAWRTRSGPEHAIVENALWGMKESVFRDADIARFAQTESVLAAATRAMIGPLAWSSVDKGPYFAVAVSDKNLSLPPYCTSLPPGGAGMGPDKYQCWSSMAYGYQLTGDADFLVKASLMGNGGNLLAFLESQGTSNIGNQAALLALLQ